MSHPFRLAVTAGSALLLAAAIVGCTSANTAVPAPTWGDSNLDPLSRYIADDDDVVAARAVAQQEIVTQCMADQGFTYVAVEQPAEIDAEDNSFYRTREWAAEHGYGIVERHLPGAEASPAATDPNVSYFNGLPPAQRTAFEEALHGTSTEDPSTLDWTEQGCSGKAEHEATSKRGPRPPILDEALNFIDSLEKDPQVVAVYDDWQKCMRENGYADEEVPGQGFAFDATVSRYVEKNPSATSEDSAVQRLKADEVTQALADRDCADEVHFVTRRLTALAELEQDYIAEHQKELEDVRLWLDQ